MLNINFYSLDQKASDVLLKKSVNTANRVGMKSLLEAWAENSLALPINLNDYLEEAPQKIAFMGCIDKTPIFSLIEIAPLVAQEASFVFIQATNTELEKNQKNCIADGLLLLEKNLKTMNIRRLEVLTPVMVAAASSKVGTSGTGARGGAELSYIRQILKDHSFGTGAQMNSYQHYQKLIFG